MGAIETTSLLCARAPNLELQDVVKSGGSNVSKFSYEKVQAMLEESGGRSLLLRRVVLGQDLESRMGDLGQMLGVSPEDLAQSRSKQPGKSRTLTEKDMSPSRSLGRSPGGALPSCDPSPFEPIVSRA